MVEGLSMWKYHQNLGYSKNVKPLESSYSRGKDEKLGNAKVLLALVFSSKVYIHGSGDSLELCLAIQ